MTPSRSHAFSGPSRTSRPLRPVGRNDAFAFTRVFGVEQAPPLSAPGSSWSPSTPAGPRTRTSWATSRRSTASTTTRRSASSWRTQRGNGTPRTARKNGARVPRDLGRDEPRTRRALLQPLPVGHGDPHPRRRREARPGARAHGRAHAQPQVLRHGQRRRDDARVRRQGLRPRAGDRASLARDHVIDHMRGRPYADVVLRVWDIFHDVSPFGFRVLDEIDAYVTAAEEVGTDWHTALDEQLMQKVLPRVRGDASAGEAIDAFLSSFRGLPAVGSQDARDAPGPRRAWLRRVLLRLRHRTRSPRSARRSVATARDPDSLRSCRNSSRDTVASSAGSRTGPRRSSSGTPNHAS